MATQVSNDVFNTPNFHRTRCSAFIRFKNRLCRTSTDFPADRQPYCATGEAGWYAEPFEHQSLAVIAKAQASARKWVAGK